MLNLFVHITSMPKIFVIFHLTVTALHTRRRNGKKELVISQKHSYLKHKDNSLGHTRKAASYFNCIHGPEESNCLVLLH
jgi:hypothetical protein